MTLKEKISKTRSISKLVDWGYISIYQKLSEDFIREFQDKTNWYCISRYQKLSEEFRSEERRVGKECPM